NKLASLFIAKLDKKNIGFALIKHTNKKIIYSEGGMIREYQWYRPSNLLLWEIMLWGKDKRCLEFDLGGGNLNKKDKLYDVHKFKMGFGANLKIIHNYYKLLVW
ncbi:MAG: GNAT family N-acetyltransferase, partial [Candidatus Hodarchaeota archaeon]